MAYKDYPDWAKNADSGEIYSGEDHFAVVKLKDQNGEVTEYQVQIYHDSFCHFYYGVNYHGRALYYENGDWVSYNEVFTPPFPDFVEEIKERVN